MESEACDQRNEQKILMGKKKTVEIDGCAIAQSSHIDPRDSLGHAALRGNGSAKNESLMEQDFQGISYDMYMRGLSCVLW